MDEMSVATHEHQALTAEQVRLPAGHWAGKVPAIGGVVGFAALAGAFALGQGDTKQLAFSFHTAYLYFLSLALGGLFFVIIQHAVAAGWSVVVRRFAEAIMGTLPLFAILFIPMIFGMHTLFHHWTDAEVLATDVLIQAKQPYLNEPFFFLRAAIYFVAWLGMAWFFYSNSTKQDTTGDHALTRRMRKWSYPFIAAFGLTLSFAALDWIMSLDPHWYSTMFGVYYFAGAVVGIYATLLIVTSLFRGIRDIGHAITVEHQHDLGKLMFGHTAFWAYITFSQYFLIWYANIPEETLWFLHRYEHGWMAFGISLMVGHFILPFLFLLPRTVKRTRFLVTFAAVWMLVMHYVDLFYMIMPTARKHAYLSPVDLLCFVGVGGLFVAWMFALLKRRALIPVKDPLLPESLAFENY
jgi:hypothetical protein